MRAVNARAGERVLSRPIGQRNSREDVFDSTSSLWIVNRYGSGKITVSGVIRKGGFITPTLQLHHCRAACSFREIAPTYAKKNCSNFW